MEDDLPSSTIAVESSIDEHPAKSGMAESAAASINGPSGGGEGSKKKRRGKRLSKAERLAKREGNSTAFTVIAAPEGIPKETHLKSLVAASQFDEAECFAHTIPNTGGTLFLAEVARNVPIRPGSSGSAKLKTVVHHAKRFAIRAVAHAQGANAFLDISRKLVGDLLQPLLRDQRWDVCAAISSALGTSLPDVPLLFPPLRIAMLALDTAERHRKAARDSKPKSTAGNDTSLGSEEGGGDELGDGGEDEQAVRAMIARDESLRLELLRHLVLTQTHAHLLPACLPALASALPSPSTLQRFDASLRLSLENSVEDSLENSSSISAAVPATATMAALPAAAPSPAARLEDVATALGARLRAEAWGSSSSGGCRVYLFGSAVLESDVSAVRDLDLCAVTAPGWVPPAPPPSASPQDEAAVPQSSQARVDSEPSLGQGKRGGKGNSSSSAAKDRDRNSSTRHRKLNEPMARLVESAHAALLRAKATTAPAAGDDAASRDANAKYEDSAPKSTTLQLSSFRAVSHARVPVLKFDASFGGSSSLTRCDLVVNNGAALLNTALQQLCFQRSPALRNLWSCVRKWITGRNLVGAISGLMSSYAWRLLVVAFCQLHCHDVPKWPSASVLAPLAESALQTALTSTSPPCAASSALFDLFPSLPDLLWPDERAAAFAAESPGNGSSVGGGDGDGISSSAAATTKRKRVIEEAELSPLINNKRARADAASTAPSSSGSQATCAELFSAFLRWVACGIDYKGRQVISLEGASSSADRGPSSSSSSDQQPWLLASRGAHAWARLRLADPVEAGRDLGSHFTKHPHLTAPFSRSNLYTKTRRGFATILAETARAHLLLTDGASLDVLASPRN